MLKAPAVDATELCNRGPAVDATELCNRAPAVDATATALADSI